MKLQFATLILVLALCNYLHRLPGGALLSSHSDCPTIMVEAPTDVDGSELVFRVKVSGGQVTAESLSYKWTVYGGDLKEGQGTPSVTITNFDLRGQSVTAVVEVERLPLKCPTSASCTLSIRPARPTSALQQTGSSVPFINKLPLAWLSLRR